METKVLINHLEINCIVGVFPHERENEQTLYFDLSLTTDFSQAVISDSMEDVVDYVAVSQLIERFVKDQKFHLLEKMSVEIVSLVYEKWNSISAIDMTIKKPGAINNTEYVGVSISDIKK